MNRLFSIIAITTLLLMGSTLTRSQPINFCAQDDMAAQEWIKRNKLEGRRWPVRRPDSDASGCLDKLKPYEAVQYQAACSSCVRIQDPSTWSATTILTTTSPGRLTVLSARGKKLIECLSIRADTSDKVENCALADGATLDELINSVVSIIRTQSDQCTQEKESIRKMGLEAVRSGQGALELVSYWRTEYQKCMKITEQFSKGKAQ